jgi:hypothetical protein
MDSHLPAKRHSRSTLRNANPNMLPMVFSADPSPDCLRKGVCVDGTLPFAGLPLSAPGKCAATGRRSDEKRALSNLEIADFLPSPKTAFTILNFDLFQ